MVTGPHKQRSAARSILTERTQAILDCLGFAWPTVEPAMLLPMIDAALERDAA